MMARQAGRIYIGDNRMEIQGKERDRRKVKEYKRKTLEKKKESQEPDNVWGGERKGLNRLEKKGEIR